MTSRIRAFSSSAGGRSPEPVPGGGDELDPGELEHALELSPPKTLVAAQEAARLAAGEVDHGPDSRDLQVEC
jgi:hypothetical protein